MSSSLNLDGYWYLPNTPGNKVPGTLRQGSRGQLVLDLFGWPYNDFALIYRSPDVILGQCRSGLPVTLVECFIEEGPVRSQEMVFSSRFGAVQALLGKHYGERKNIKTKIVHAGFTKSYLWKIGYPIHRIPRNESNRKKFYKEIYTNKPINLCKTAKFGVRYKEIVRSSPNADGSSYAIESYFEITTRRQIELDEFRPIIRALQAFLSLGCRVPVSLNALRFVGKPKRDAFRWVEAHGKFTTNVEEEPDEHERSVTRADNLFGVPELRQLTNKIPSKWLENIDNFLPIYLLFQT